MTLGSGGMAKVYKARQESLDRRVAIKELREDLARDPSLVERFEREAQFAARLQHEGIVHVYDFFREEGSYYIVMEYVDGTDLGAVLKKAGPLPPEIAALIALRLVRALEHAHRHGVIHRDIKPGNVLVSKAGDLKLGDFGIAKLDGTDPKEVQADLTRTGQAIGTPSYMSPEQIMGDSLTFNSDLFSAGIVLYEMLVGAKPFTSDTANSLLDKIRSQGYVDVRTARPGTPRALAKIVRRCMKKEPRKRWKSTTDLRLELEDFVRRRVRVSTEDYLREWLFDAGIFPREEKKPLANATTMVNTGKDAVSALRVWIPRAAIGGIALVAMAAFAVGPQLVGRLTPTPAATPRGTPTATLPGTAHSSPATTATSTPPATSTPTTTPAAIFAPASATPMPSMAVGSNLAAHPEAGHSDPEPTPRHAAVPRHDPEPTPSPEPSAEPARTPRERPAATPTHTTTPHHEATATATPRTTPHASASAHASPSPTPTPTPKKTKSAQGDDGEARRRR